MAKLQIALIHGIGKNGPGYSKDLTDGIAREFNQILRSKLKTSIDYSKNLNFIEIVWDDIVSVNQAKLAYIFRHEFERRNKAAKRNLLKWFLIFLALSAAFSLIFKTPWFWALLVFPAFIKGKKLLDALRSDFAAEFVSDIIGYRDKEAFEAIQERIAGDIGKHADLKIKQRLTFISHSLGTVIASDFIYERRKTTGEMHPSFELANFITMGSPLALFSLRYGPEMFCDPITVDKPGQWINIYDNDDPIAYPLKPLNDAYAKAVHKDVEVNVGLLGLAHVNYWKNETVQNIIAQKLAEDWLHSQ